jgi:hypothetical protein
MGNIICNKFAEDGKRTGYLFTFPLIFSHSPAESLHGQFGQGTLTEGEGSVLVTSLLRQSHHITSLVRVINQLTPN